nr:unnamed protein product [Haemonchus contortus]
MTSTFTHSDMQWVFVHHLLRNEELLESCGLAEDLQRSNAYFEELNRIRQGVPNNNDDAREPSFTYQCDSGDMVPNSELSESAALLEKIHQMQEKVNRKEYLDKETVRHVIDVTQKSVKDVEERAAKVVSIRNQSLVGKTWKL